MKIRKIANKLIKKNATLLCSLAFVSATLATNSCTYRWYQEKEPEGLAEFAKRVK
ncbi:MAG: cyclic lactone autoinducer peptide [Lachnospiraceae bacterium]|nr:cyclic lactone autoinducer peptide [Lachnospiraceae bacterium]